MKKIYKNLSIVVATLLATASMNAAEDPSITIIGFDSNSSLTETASGSNSSINVVFTGASVVTTSANADVNGSAYNGNILQINSGGTVTVSRPTPANDVIENVALLCNSLSSNTDVVAEFSTFAAPNVFSAGIFSPANVLSIDALGNKAYKLTPLSADYGDGDLTSNLFDAYDDGYIEDSPEDIKSIRFTVGSNDPLLLFGILVYTDLTGTGMQSNETAKTPQSSVYYDLTGKVVPETTRGFVIKKTVYADSSITAEKFCNK